MLAMLAPIFASGLGGLVDWLRRRRILKDAAARNFYAWVESLGERHAWPVELRASFIAQRKRLEALRDSQVPQGNAQEGPAEPGIK